jgi:hypothetical protein
MRASLTMRASRTSSAVAAAFLLIAALAFSASAGAVERNFAASAQLDYQFAPTVKAAKAFPGAFDGFTTELAAKIAVDFSARVSANMKICYGCHGFEADMAYFDLRIADELNFRVGRFSPSFGGFNLRHDPANHRLSDKPLPYDMGRMLRLRQWNMGVLPSPFPDNGLEIDGVKSLGQSVQIDYALYAVSGFKADARPLDIDFSLSRAPYYVDNNGRPTFGARISLATGLGDSGDLTLGASSMYGTYDPDNHLAYGILGADLSLRLEKTNIRLEYLGRRTEFDTSDPSVFKYTVPASRSDYFMKHGAYAEIERALTPELDIIGRVDGMYRVGNVAATSELSRKSAVLRYTLGTAYAIERGLRVKFSTELWNFSSTDVTDGRRVELSMHAALAGSF